MAAAAHQTLGIVGTEPLFYGEDILTQGLSSEEWLRRVDSFMAANAAIAPAGKAALALGWMRGDAAAYFTETLLFHDPATHAATIVDWVDFRAAFHAHYCLVASTADISIDWSTLRQGERESVQAFGDRISRVMHRYITLLPSPAVPIDDLQPLSDAILAIRAADAGLAARQLVTAEVLAAVERAHRRALRSAITDMAIKTFADGLRNSKLRELVRREERLRTPFLQILTLARSTERNMADARIANSTGKGKNVVAGVSGSEEKSPASPAGPEPQDGASAVNQPSGRGKNKGRGSQRGGGRGRGRGNGQARSSTRTDFSKPPTKPCPFCSGPGHWMKDCPIKAKLLNPAASAVNTAPPPPRGPVFAPVEYFAQPAPTQDQGNFFATV